MILKAGEELIAVMIRGDHELNLAKIKNFLNVPFVELASPEEIVKATNGALGFSGPIGINIKFMQITLLKG